MALMSSLTEEQHGLTDDRVLRLAFDDARTLLTLDKDFGDLVVRLGRPAVGVVLLRLASLSGRSAFERVLSVLQEHRDRIEHRYVVIHDTRVRIRPLRPDAAQPAPA